MHLLEEKISWKEVWFSRKQSNMQYHFFRYSVIKCNSQVRLTKGLSLVVSVT